MKRKHFQNYRLHVKHDRDVEMAGLKNEHPLAITDAQQRAIDDVVADGFFPEPATLSDAVALRTNDVPWLTAELYNRLQASGQTMPLAIVTTYVRKSVYFNTGCQLYQERLIAGLVRAGYEASVIKSTLAVSRIKPELVDFVAGIVAAQDQIKPQPQPTATAPTRRVPDAFDHLEQEIENVQQRLHETTDPVTAQHLREVLDSLFDRLTRVTHEHSQRETAPDREL